jgi:hypothetical protein
MKRQIKKKSCNMLNKFTSDDSVDRPKYALHPVEIVSKLTYKDERHREAMENFVARKTANNSGSVLEVMGGRGFAKQAYNLIDNENIDYDKFHDDVVSVTKDNLAGLEEVLVVQDTMHVNLAGHVKTEGLGLQCQKALGLLVHSAVAHTTQGESIGILHQQITTRLNTEGTIFSLDHEGRPIEAKESFRWIDTFRSVRANLPEGVRPIMIADRECDIYEAIVDGVESGAGFIFRAAQNRKTQEEVNLFEKISSQPSLGSIFVDVSHNSRLGLPEKKMELEIKATEITILKPKRSTTKDAPTSVTINVVMVTELNPLGKNKPAQWILLTNLAIKTKSEIEKIVRYYALRWRIETFHYVLKSGLAIEKIQQRKFESYKPLIYICSIIACYIIQITYVARINPNLSCEAYFGADEWKLLYRLATRKEKSPKKPYTMKEAVDYISILGCGKRSKSDGPPGVKSVWKGLRHLYIVANALENLDLWKHL